MLMDDASGTGRRTRVCGGGREVPVGTPARDRQLVLAAALGDEAAWNELVDVHAQSLWTGLLQAGLERDEVVAACELVWVRLAQALPSLGGDPLTIWLHRTAMQEGEQACARAGRTTAYIARQRDRRRSAREGCR